MASARRAKTRIIIPGDVYPEDHEIATARILVKAGDVEFLTPNRTRGSRSPDVTWQNLDWEIKCPFGRGKRTIVDMIRDALRQSRNIILDLRQTKLNDDKIVDEFCGKNAKNILRGVQRLKIITKEDEIVDIK